MHNAPDIFMNYYSMARKPRIHAPNSIYHVIIRGNNKQAIFFSEEDRNRYYLLLQEVTTRFRVLCC